MQCAYKTQQNTRCKKSAAVGSTLCHIHRKKADDDEKAKETGDAHNPDASGSKIDDVEDSMSVDFSMPTAPIQLNDMKDLIEQVISKRNDIDVNQQILESIQMLTEKVAQMLIQLEQKKPVTNQSVQRKAKDLFYKDFRTQQTELIEKMTMAAVSTGLLKAGKKLPSVNIRQQSDYIFDEKLEATIRDSYINKAKSLLHVNA